MLDSKQLLDREQMKSIMAGGGGQVYVTCANCQNSSCQGWADDCTTGAYEICGPGGAGSSDPAHHDCVTVN